jgi:hypothetical protein
VWPSLHLSCVRLPWFGLWPSLCSISEPSGLGLRPSTHISFHASSVDWSLTINCVPYLEPSGLGLWPSTHPSIIHFPGLTSGHHCVPCFEPSGLGLRPSTHSSFMQLPWFGLWPSTHLSSICFLVLASGPHCVSYLEPSGLGLRPSTRYSLMQLPYLGLCHVCLPIFDKFFPVHNRQHQTLIMLACPFIPDNMYLCTNALSYALLVPILPHRSDFQIFK